MYPSKHLILGIIFSLILFAIFPNIRIIGIILIILSTFFIDVDHYFYYVFEKNDLGLINAYRWFDKKTKQFRKMPLKKKAEYKYPHLIFHGIEFWVILFVLSFYYNFLIFFYIGVIFHMFLDYIMIIYEEWPLYIKFSQIFLFINNKNKKNLDF